MARGYAARSADWGRENPPTFRLISFKMQFEQFEQFEQFAFG